MGKDHELKFKVIKEYDRFYLAEDSKGRKECFDKIFHKPDKDGYIIKYKDLKHEQEFYGKEEEASEG